MSFRTEKHDNYSIIVFSTDKLDSIVAPDLKSELVLINKSGEKNIIMDLSSVKYCDSSGLSAILTGYRVCQQSNGIFIICGLQTAVEKLMTISQLTTVLDITTTLPTALDLFYEKQLSVNSDENNANE
ncbi:MAG: STAS domain-containing protein [Flavobacteriales bacterium]|nr:STAS domain-containing protein [Flavobacteriales bacterium]MCW8914080.1 STAS domain-containing protein [Flavobacteriales bacterium]MCW8938138.1 STAS domain-containing protein [Flavobacteriales bacterium]MCW8939785.1 STAS domain-containing protein [Flavobacteriales bacterium]MCW8968243.1 STAS domain-containing protein [Flavobacteriales bacterium]